MGSSFSGQAVATDDEVEEAMRMLVQSLSAYFVIDGVDECDDVDHLGTFLFSICATSGCRMLLLSRPDIEIPRSLKRARGLGMITTVQLSSRLNFPDIHKCIGDSLDLMTEDGFFGSVALPPGTSQRAAEHANGIFLWASLFASYLKIPALTPKQRHNFVADCMSFEGLDALILGILRRLDERSQPERTVVLKIFRWITAALYPVSVEALHTAIAITPGEETNELDYLVDFPGCLPRLTGSLIELDGFGRPSFMHLSLKEFLTTPRSTGIPFFSLNNAMEVHQHLAITCLSYLTHDIPLRPLRPLIEEHGRPLTHDVLPAGHPEPGSSDVQADPELNADNALGHAEERFPLLSYATLSWPQHLFMSEEPPHQNFRTNSQPGSSGFSPSQQPLSNYVHHEKQHTNSGPAEIPGYLPHLSRFLICRKAVTNWVESNYHYHLMPSLQRLIPQLHSLASLHPTTSAESREVHWVLHGMDQLAKALDGFTESQKARLQANSTLIWQEEIQAATDGSYWPVWGNRSAQLNAPRYYPMDVGDSFQPRYRYNQMVHP